MQYSFLERRTVFGISGEDRYSFLQGIITNDIYKLTSKKRLLQKFVPVKQVQGAYGATKQLATGIEFTKKSKEKGSNAIYGLILTPQGKLLYDVFIIEKSDMLLIDCPSEYIWDIINYLKRYKLRAKVEIIDLQNQMKVAVSFQHIEVDSCFRDPRNPEIGYRAIVDFSYPVCSNTFLEEYEEKRISLLIPDIIKDFSPMQFFPAELGMDLLNAIDYQKGCYIGQEVTARVKYRGTVRKKLCLITSEDKDFENVASKEYDKFKILGSSNKKALAMVYINALSQ